MAGSLPGSGKWHGRGFVDLMVCFFKTLPLLTKLCPVDLPLRGRRVHIREASTRHGIGVGRAIDLVFCSPSLVVDVSIHNGLHCTNWCPLEHCQETCRGDHFLIQVDVHVQPGRSLGPAGPAFPGKWHDATKWAAALGPAESVLQSLSSIVHVAAVELCLLGH